MVPSDLVVVDEIPTLPSGKTDRAALPEPPSSGTSTGAPSGKLVINPRLATLAWISRRWPVTRL